MSLSELASFALSGSAATALSAMITDGLVPEDRRQRSRQHTHGTTSRPVGAGSAASGFVFFLTYFIAATTRSHASTATRSTGRAASDAFVVGATASVFARLFGPHPDAAATPAGYRWSMPALEDDVVLALDPGITFGVHEVLARVAAGFLQRRHQQQQQHGPHQQHWLGATVTTFVLAATSKAIAAALTYPLHTAAAEATERRYAAAVMGDTADTGDEPLIMLSEDVNGRRVARENARGRRRHSILVVLMQMLRTQGVRSLYIGWLRSVVAAALCHGMTMALQRSIYGFLLRLMQAARPPAAADVAAIKKPDAAVASPRAVLHQPEADPVEVPSVLPTSPAPLAATQASPATIATPPTPATPVTPAAPAFPEEDRIKVKNAVESWLDTSSVASDGTVDVDDSISNISVRTRQAMPVPSVAASRRPQQQQTTPLTENAVARYNRRGGASRVPSRVSAPAFYRGGAGMPAASVVRGSHIGPMDDDDTGSLVFNMVSKSPRVIPGEDE